MFRIRLNISESKRAELAISAMESTTDRTTESTTEWVLRLIKENPRITNAQIATIVGITEDGVYYHTTKLRKDGKIVRRDGKQKGYWEIIE